MDNSVHFGNIYRTFNGRNLYGKLCQFQCKLPQNCKKRQNYRNLALCESTIRRSNIILLPSWRHLVARVQTSKDISTSETKHLEAWMPIGDRLKSQPTLSKKFSTPVWNLHFSMDAIHCMHQQEMLALPNYLWTIACMELSWFIPPLLYELLVLYFYSEEED